MAPQVVAKRPRIRPVLEPFTKSPGANAASQAGRSWPTGPQRRPVAIRPRVHGRVALRCSVWRAAAGCLPRVSERGPRRGPPVHRRRGLRERGPAVLRTGSSAACVTLSRGEVSEWLKVPLSKSGVRKHRGFESHPLRQQGASPGRPCVRWPLWSVAHAPPMVRSLPVLASAFAWTPMRPADISRALPPTQRHEVRSSPRRGRLEA